MRVDKWKRQPFTISPIGLNTIDFFLFLCYFSVLQIYCSPDLSPLTKEVSVTSL